ncbi:UDP-N-acetylmuramoyl-L-alanine--D-glutamate ligase [Pseudoalteromonas tunicata]|uniref:UDP-N-acetylmuramoyl-L-alanine--D-glutamate ligase n=1 Tax=Pseudoalteromonas tunicata TaxID=314281 RepID=UPI00273E3FA4|nr:UDP-N-acetylmuramoyl-L-alanine--D-glutamate ligase [Pseudoalteromonas tunicata]MDP5213523.1 UDP-N-acetylmuramoyl-L-alanine--D-glutamate ligase [Pseudoalteromonas tunicata]
MNYLTRLKTKKIIVLGLGVSGLSTVRFLLGQTINPIVVDSRAEPPGAEWLISQAPHLVCYFGSLSQAPLTEVDMIIISPGIALSTHEVQQAIAANVEVIGDIELFARINDKPVVAVTGSNGKSTVVTLAARVLADAGYDVGLAGNIGISPLDLFASEIDVFVLELSSFQLETTTSLAPISATILNLCEDHMDRYAGMDEYCAAKQTIYRNAQWAVYNQADLLTYPHEAKATLSFGESGSDYHLEHDESGSFFAYQQQTILPVSDLTIVGKHNQLNALAVMALLKPFNIDSFVYSTSFKAFTGLAHRCQFVAQIDGVNFYNDSKATNVGACISSIEGLYSPNKRLILIVGGDGKGADFSPLQHYFAAQVSELICLGRDGKALAALKAGSHFVSSMAQAVACAKKLAASGDNVLLAPACASLDMYSNYMARGDDFVHCVTEEEL